MNQKEFKKFGKNKQVPANVLKWIWSNKETLLALIALLFPKKKDEPDVQAKGGDEEKEPDPGTTPPAP